jgi:hypothetical protein
MNGASKATIFPLSKARRRQRVATQESTMNDAKSKLSRRHVFAGAGALGALAATATVLPGAKPVAPTAAAPKPEADQGGGYRLTAHIERYYQTTKV